MNNPADATISRIIMVLEENADYLETIDAASHVHLYYEAQHWNDHGFTSREVAKWIRAGYEGFADVARVLRDAGLTPRQAGCAMADNRELLEPGKEDAFVRRALAYRNCCLGRP